MFFPLHDATHATKRNGRIIFMRLSTIRELNARVLEIDCPKTHPDSLFISLYFCVCGACGCGRGIPREIRNSQVGSQWSVCKTTALRRWLFVSRTWENPERGAGSWARERSEQGSEILSFSFFPLANLIKRKGMYSLISVSVYLTRTWLHNGTMDTPEFIAECLIFQSPFCLRLT